LTIRESARSTDVRSTRVNDWQPEAADPPSRWVGRRGQGLTPRESPRESAPSSGRLRGVRFREGRRATEPPAPSGVGARKVRPSNAVPSQPTRRHRSDRREAFRFREAARRQRRAAESHGSVLREGPPLHGVRSSIATERLWTAWCPRGYPKSSHRDTHAVAGCFGLVRTAGERIARTLFGAREPPRSMRWCQRRCDWSVWTRDPDTYSADAPPLLRVGWQRPRMRQPPAVGRRSLRLSRLRDQDFGTVHTASRRDCAALNAAAPRSSRRPGRKRPGLT